MPLLVCCFPFFEKPSAHTSIDQINSASSVALNATDTNLQNLEETSSNLSNSIQEVISVSATLNPGVQQCKAAVKVVQNASALLNAAIADIIAGKPLKVANPNKKTLAQSQADIMESVKGISADGSAMVACALASNFDGLAEVAKKFDTTLPKFVDQIKLTALLVGEGNSDISPADLLDMAKNLADSLQTLIGDVATFSPGRKEAEAKLSRDQNVLNENIGKLLNTMQSERGLLDDIEATIAAVKAATSAIDVCHVFFFLLTPL